MELTNKKITSSGIISDKFLSLGINDFHEACAYVHNMPYGYNSGREDILILFKENRGSCTTKHAVIAALAVELNLDILKHIGIYKMTEEIVTGTDEILKKYDLPYLPMIHCFLKENDISVDLTEGNNNGKNTGINEFIYTEKAIPNISSKDEYLIYRKTLETIVLKSDEMKHTDMKTLLKAREEGLILLKSKV